MKHETSISGLSDTKATPVSSKPRRIQLRTIATGLLSLVAIVLGILMFVPGLMGFQRYVITSGSMTGSYDTGSIVYSKPVPVGTLKVGDVITYKPPAGASSRTLVTHRIYSIDRDASGNAVYRTKGDANAQPDAWTFTLDEQTQPKAEFHVPYAGYAFAALNVKWVRLLVIAFPALLIAFAAMAKLWREAGERQRADRQAAQAALDAA